MYENYEFVVEHILTYIHEVELTRAYSSEIQSLFDDFRLTKRAEILIITKIAF